MLLPPQYAWFEPVLIASIVVFVIDVIGNSITFANRFVSALVSAILFAIVFGALVYFGYGNVSMSVVSLMPPCATNTLSSMTLANGNHANMFSYSRVLSLTSANNTASVSFWRVTRRVLTLLANGKPL